MSNSQIATDIEQLMARIQTTIDAHPDSRPLLDSIQDCRFHAGGVCELAPFSSDLISRTKSLVYRGLMRAFSRNFERQSLFNHALVNTLAVMAKDLDEIRRRQVTNNDDQL